MADKIITYSPGDCYAVIHVPSEDDHSRKSFYLRTGDCIETVVASAGEEFTDEDIELAYNTGTFEIEDGVISITPVISPHLTYLVAEGLFYQGFVSSDDSVSSVVTLRKPSRALYDSNTGFVTAMEEVDENLLELLTAPEETATINIAGPDLFYPFMHDIDYDKLARGFITRTLVAMNYGYIYSKGSSFVLDGRYGDDEASWYVLPNDSETLDGIQRRFNENAAVGRLSKSSEFTFSEADKVSRRFLFDGTVRDLVLTLVEQGIELDDDLELDDFSD